MEFLTLILMVGLIIFTVGNINYHMNVKKIDPHGANKFQTEFYRNSGFSIFILITLFLSSPLTVEFRLLFFVVIGIAIYFQYKLHQKYRQLVSNEQKFRQVQRKYKDKGSIQVNKSIGVAALVIGTITIVGVMVGFKHMITIFLAV